MISGVTILLDFDTSIDSLSTPKKRMLLLYYDNYDHNW
jgi:hypothetical protein